MLEADPNLEMSQGVEKMLVSYCKFYNEEGKHCSKYSWFLFFLQRIKHFNLSIFNYNVQINTNFIIILFPRICMTDSKEVLIF